MAGNYFGVEYKLPCYAVARMHVQEIDKFASINQGYVTFIFLDHQRAFFRDTQSRQGFIDALIEAKLPFTNQILFETERPPRPRNRNGNGRK